MWDITLRDVMLNWAFSEALSPKWRDRYANYMPAESFSKVQPTTRFDKNILTESEQDKFIECLKAYRHFILDQYLVNTSAYRIQSGTQEQVKDYGVIHEMHWSNRPVGLSEFSQMPYDESFAGDPRNVAKQICDQNTLSFSGMPILIANKDHKDGLLIEGYSRCLAFVHKAKDDELLWSILCE